VDDLARALGWLRDVASDRAERTVTVPGGRAVLHSGFPDAHDHNRLLLWSEVDASTAAASADAVLGGAGLRHRLIEAQDVELAGSLQDGLAALGYQRSTNLLMAHRPPDPAVERARQEAAREQVARRSRELGSPRRPLGPGSGAVTLVELDVGERAAVAAAGWQQEQPTWPAGVVAQLGARIRTIRSAAEATFLACRDDAGAVLARADLYVRDGVAQVEEVVTAPSARERGFASALVLEAVRRGRAAGCDLVFLVADADERPAELYRRLGFADLGRTASFTR
jgi:ribosomal protein S18 acetylase RimI-like enzyme